MSTLGGGGGGGGQAAAGSFSELVQLTSKLSDDIGKMSLQIGYMADRIVETEKLIVSVISSQTAAASTIIAAATMKRDPNTPDVVPAKLFPIPPSPLYGFKDISGAAGAVLTASMDPMSSLPGITIGGATPVIPYQLLIYKNATFGTGNTINQTVNPTANPGTPASIDTVWTKSIGPGPSGLNLANGAAVFIAVKTINGAVVSGPSNSIELQIP